MDAEQRVKTISLKKSQYLKQRKNNSLQLRQTFPELHFNSFLTTYQKNEGQNKQYYNNEPCSVCCIPSNFLETKSIKPIHRMQLKLWFMVQMRNIDMSRETYTTASRYLDQYFSRGKDVKLSSFQNLGVTCFMLAGKSVQRKCPQFTFENYGLQEILKFQTQLCNLLRFDLFPVTYFHLAEIIMSKWDQLSQFKGSSCRYLQKSNDSINRYRSILDTLDYVDLLPHNYLYNIECIVVCIFYLKNYTFLYPGLKFPQPQQLEKFLLDQNSDYNIIFQEFMQYLSEDEYFIKINISLETLQFIQLFVEQPLIYTGRKPKKQITYDHMNQLQYRYHMLVQNYNPSHEKLAKSFFNRNP